ncbi:MAG: DUF6788 family protein [Gammaproteobacteria bacterium]
MKARLLRLDAKIRAIQRELATLSDLRPGTLTRQYTVCGSPGCRCKGRPPQKHGPYYHLSYTRHGKGGTRLIKPADVPMIRTAVANYARLKRLIDRWIDLATERSDLTLQRRAAGNSAAKPR